MKITQEEYAKGVLTTESNDFEKIRSRMTDELIRIDHAVTGIATEAGELEDAVKKHKFYGKPLDKTNLIEELGDLYWYMNVLQDALGVTTDEVQAINNAKLRARYGEKFSEDAAINRDLELERKVLEG